MKGKKKKKSTKKKLKCIYTRTYEERAALSWPRLGTPRDGHRAPASPQELLSHTQCSHPGFGGWGGKRGGFAWGNSRPERRSNAFGGGLTFADHPPRQSLPCRSPAAKPGAGGGAQPAPTLDGWDHCLGGGSKGRGSQPRLFAGDPLCQRGCPKSQRWGEGGAGAGAPPPAPPPPRWGAAGATQVG